jgi:hypothetical protein
VTEAPELGRVWRVGLASDPLGFIPAERRSYNSRFDDLLQRFATLYCALLAETALREVLADLPPTLRLSRATSSSTGRRRRPISHLRP